MTDQTDKKHPLTEAIENLISAKINYYDNHRALCADHDVEVAIGELDEIIRTSPDQDYGEKTMTDKPRTEMWRIGNAAIVIRNGHVLLGQRQDTEQWEFPGGKVDWADKNMVDAVVRELEEETGLTPYRDNSFNYDYNSGSGELVEFIGYGENDGHNHDSQWLCLFYRFHGVTPAIPESREPDKHKTWTWHPLTGIPTNSRELVAEGLTKCVGKGGWKYYNEIRPIGSRYHNNTVKCETCQGYGIIEDLQHGQSLPCPDCKTK